MCGIVGLIAKNANGFSIDECDLFTNMLQMDTIRGDDSTGAFGVDEDGKIDIIKGDTDGWTFTQCKNYSDFRQRIYSNYKLVIGHNRAATKGAVSPHNAHPFKEDKIVLVHNGTIYNKDDLAKDTDVDSHAITKALSKADAATALNQIHGPFALVWFDGNTKSLNLARNNERPLFLIEYLNFWTISSEPGLPYWLAGRSNNKPVNVPKLVPTEKILQFRLDTLKNGYSEVDFDNYVYKAPPVSHTYPISGTDLTARRSLHIVSSQSDRPCPIKQGDTIIFNVDEVKHEEGEKVWTIFGHPIFNN